ncbi:hypothetical protein AALO_G00296450 [Alosa alosa]|uniref:Saposin B-type domain-containing protein n=1 Tax=Alosa alosa TaxID=278164 RepID=A0AAV6FDC8_9TELE|nr:prosaposin [Alosa alosa]XP_048092142.1 prosaposin [Alosa alosa]KAG5260773.1 hypothetical protein AALO_G00296450 [Alosa alosa]
MSTFFNVLILMCFQYAVPAQVTDTDNLKAVPGQLPLAKSCETCTKLFDLLKELLVDTEVQGMTKSDMNTKCERLLGSGRAELCKLMMDKNLPVFFTLADKVIKPGHLCSALGFCVDTENELPGQMALKAPYFADTFGIQCLFCTQLIGSIESFLPTDELEDALTMVMDLGCSVLPDSSKMLCQTVVEKAIKTVMELLMSVLSPDTICSLLQLCTD